MTRYAAGEGPRGRSITTLPDLVQALPQATQQLFQRLYAVSRSTGRLIPPPSMQPWIRNFFGSVEAVENQTVVKVTNLVTMESALFNGLRASRPVDVKPSGDLQQTIDQSAGDPFCNPEQGTPEDIFGRVKGKHSITASNIAKYDAFHGLVIFDRHNPLQLSEEGVRDHLEVGSRWAQEALKADPEAKYYFFMWNALWKSGASIIHGHAQVACTRDMHYAGVERLRRAAQGYRQQYGSDYFADLVEIHRQLGLVVDYGGGTILAHLTPTKEKELLILTPGLGEPLPSTIYRSLDCLVGQMGVSSFNLVIYMPPLAEVPEDWTGFPHITRIVDRGDPMSRTNDVGAMELYASPVISSDPFRVIEGLRERFSN
jgi:hypothetical protein